MSMTRLGTERWLVPARSKAQAPTTIVCFPSAGAGATFFAGWRRLLPADVEALAVELPGRESRLGEVPLRDAAAVVDRVGPLLSGLDARQLVLFGHSLGALLAYEVAHWLRDHDGTQPAALIVSASRPPHLPSRLAGITACDDAGVVEGLRRMGCDPSGALSDPEVAELFMPALRADLTIVESYGRARRARPLDIPVLALFGRDDLLTDAGDMADWAEHTAADYAYREFPGGHLFVRDHQAEVVAVVIEEVRRRVARQDRSC